MERLGKRAKEKTEVKKNRIIHKLFKRFAKTSERDKAYMKYEMIIMKDSRKE
ncbi:MAG: hypothetical protein IKK59_02675 [Lachnospiraceae bacterium]|nr:hypothetical protein [Lachnospiraceae bacterium]